MQYAGLTLCGEAGQACGDFPQEGWTRGGGRLVPFLQLPGATMETAVDRGNAFATEAFTFLKVYGSALEATLKAAEFRGAFCGADPGILLIEGRANAAAAWADMGSLTNAVPTSFEFAASGASMAGRVAFKGALIEE